MINAKNVWEKYDKNEIMDFSDGYISYLDNSKTERLCIEHSVNVAEANGFKEYKSGMKLTAGDKIYQTNRGKNLVLAVIGTDEITDGINLIASHVDSPRLDLKPIPLYEDSNLVLFKTHYYGGIKKYQWTSIPLSLIGVVILNNGMCAEINIGEDEDDPVFTVTDLLPHLAKDQMVKPMSEGFTGEDLNVLIGSIPSDSEKDKFKNAILNLFNEKYGITEEDFISAELEIVPSFKARSVGLDSSMVGAYGQDDRVCGYTSFKAMLDIDTPKRTSICFLADKEEIGSMGNTGMKSRFFENFLAELINSVKGEYNELYLKRTLSNSRCLSSDVTNGTDPTYKSVGESNNSAYLGEGICICKYTGARGKSSTSDANAEFVGFIRKLFNDNDIVWQIAELGKVDQGGGGTVAQFIANLDVDTIDCGVPLLSMHAPFEIASKGDVYMAYKAYKAFYLS